ncbi:RHS repeat-associated core domain-containing protein [Actinoplanes sp. CA-051413]|uniref:RHS repeat-associated core domain-containing protein n=1 Tax=Actinoplanes sp. CA-051413 TaxID=3239899 RepID=UPI003D954AE9
MIVLARAWRTRPGFPVLAALVLLLLISSAAFGPPPAQAAPARPAPVAPPGPGPVDRPLPADTVANHGLKPGARPPVVPPGLKAAGAQRKISPSALAEARDEPPTSDDGATNVLLRPGFAFEDTSLVVYFDAAAPGVSSWTSWKATVYDPESGTAQESVALTAADVSTCTKPRKYCKTFGADQGWVLTGDHPYFVTVSVTLADGTVALSGPSGNAKARKTANPPAVPAQQAAGCGCGNALAPTTIGQALRGAGVSTGTGAFSLAWTDLQMAGYGVPFQATRKYSSASPTAGSMGIGWSWTYDLKVIPPAAGETAVTVRAEDGAQVVYQAAADGAYTRPPGVRSQLRSAADGWTLTTPAQTVYTFDASGRLTAIRDPRGAGPTLTYTATAWTITDPTGRKVTVEVGSDGLVRKITLPDGRFTKYAYSNRLLVSATDAEGATWTFGYSGGLLAKVVDPRGRAQATNTYVAGRVVKQVDAAGAVTTFDWNAAEQEATTVDADGVHYFDGYRGNVLVYSQNGNGDTVNHRYDEQIDPNLLVDAQGNQTASVYDGSGNLTSMAAPDPFSYAVSNTYDARNNLTSHTDALGHTARFGYSAFDELVSITDAGGDQTVLKTDEHGLVTELIDPRGKVTKMAYDAAGNLISQVTPLGEKNVLAYDKTGRLIRSTNPRGFSTGYGYDKLDRLRQYQEPAKDRPFEYVYDEVGQLTKTIDPVKNTHSFTYFTVTGRTATETDANGNTTSTAYTKAGRRASITDPSGAKTTFGYDNRGNLSTVVSPRGNVKGANPANFTTTYTYDFNSNRVRVTHPYPSGGFVSQDTRFDELNRAVASIDPFGQQSTTNYDDNGNVLSTVDPLGQETTFDYDVNGRPKAVTTPAGGGTTTEFDPAGNPVKQTAPDGGVTTLAYNDNGDLISVTDPRGNVAGAEPKDYTSTYAYDATRNLTAITDQLGGRTAFTYDASDRVTAATDALKHTTTYRYDDADRMTRIVAADSGVFAGPSLDTSDRQVTAYAYDGAGHVVKRTDPNGNVRSYDYDKVGRLASVTDALGRQTAYTYDAEDNLQKVVTPGEHDDAAARSIVNTYDILGRHVGQDLGAGSLIYAWGYDAKNRITSLADQAGLRTQRYDAAGRLTSIGRGDGQNFSYGYDANGNVTSRTWPDGTKVGAAYDTSDRMVSLTAQGGAAGTAAAEYAFAYDISGRISRTTYPGGTAVTDRAYDRAGRLSDLNSHDADGVIARFQADRDANGNPTAVTTTRGDRSQRVGYSYDVTDRLTAACVGDGCATGKTEYAYDQVGNRLSQKVVAGDETVSTKYRYDAADQLTKATLTTPQRIATTEYEYDPSGNQVKAGADRFTYNLDHTLASATVGAVRTSYTYDAQGVQLSAVSNLADGVQSRSWQNDHNSTLPRLSMERTETTTSGSARGFLTGPSGTPIGLMNGGKVDSFVPDFLGGVADVVSTSGDSKASYDYDPFGNARTNGTATGSPSVDNPIGFTGYYQDSTLGDRYSTLARAYDPATGRFGGVDPAASPLNSPASSSYAYVGNKPTTYTDPSGAVVCSGRGGNNDHGDAVELSLRQLDVQYGPFNVYGECPEHRRTLHGVPGSVPAPGRKASPSNYYCFATTEPNSCVDVLVSTPAATYLYEVKPGTDQQYEYGPDNGKKGVNNASQVQRYLWALAYAGYPNPAAGPDIVPDARTYEDGSILTIFAGSDWSQYAPKGARQADNSSGIIYYHRTKPPKVPTGPPSNPKRPPNTGQNEEPKQEPTKVPTQGPVSDPGVVSSGVVEDVILVAAVVVAVVVVVVFWPEIVAATAIGGLIGWATS